MAFRGMRRLCIFRVAQEGLRNIKRHSGANRAEVRLEWSGERLHLLVSDRGRGFAGCSIASSALWRRNSTVCIRSNSSAMAVIVMD
jgi:signal transduction histidine kinase